MLNVGGRGGYIPIWANVIAAHCQRQNAITRTATLKITALTTLSSYVSPVIGLSIGKSGSVLSVVAHLSPCVEAYAIPAISDGGCAVIKSSKKTLKKARMIAALDKACRKEVVEARDWNTCQRCGDIHGTYSETRKSCRPVVIQWAHVHTREYYVTRWEPDNSLALCDSCHVFFDNHKVLSYEWFRKKWPERWEHISNVLRVSTKTSDAWVKEKYQEMKNGTM